MIVLDSSFLIGFYNEIDAHHKIAKPTMEKVYKGEWGKALLPEYVFLEIMTVLMARIGLSKAVSFGEELLKSSEIDFIAGSEFFSDAMKIFQSQKKPTLSFVDAAIVAIAKKYETPFIATFDTDFESIEGLRLIP